MPTPTEFLKTELEKIKTQSDDYQKKWVDSLIELETSQKKVKELDSELENLTTKKDSLLKQVNESKEQNTKLENNLTNKDQALVKLQNQFIEKESQITNLTNQNADLNQKISHLEENFKEAIQFLNNYVDLLNNQVEQLDANYLNDEELTAEEKQPYQTQKQEYEAKIVQVQPFINHWQK